MKSKLLFAPLYSLLLIASLPTTVLASTPFQDRNDSIRDATEEKREEIRNIRTTDASRSDKIKQIQQAQKEMVEKIHTARQTFRSERAKLHGERLQRRFAWYEERLNNIATRIQTRIDKEKTEGKNVTTAQTALDNGKTALATAVADGNKAVSMFAAITTNTWDIQKPEVKAAIDQAQTARKGFVNARKLMMDAVKALATN